MGVIRLQRSWISLRKMQQERVKVMYRYLILYMVEQEIKLLWLPSTSDDEAKKHADDAWTKIREKHPSANSYRLLETKALDWQPQ